MKLSKLVPLTLIIPSLLFTGCSSDSSNEAAGKESSNSTTEQTETTASTASKELEQAVADYRQYGLEQTDIFVEGTTEFVEAVKAGDLEKAKELYPTARMPFERIEPIAESFGDLDPKIDAREGDVPEEEWTGYHRLEKILWEENTTEGTEKYADQLLNDVKSLRAKIELADVQPQTLVTGAVDLLNEVSSSKITGEEERYSHTDLYDFAANVDGAKKIVELLNPVLKEKDAELASTLDSRFNDVYDALEQYKTENGYVSYTELTEEDTQKLSKAIDALAEPLSQIGIVLEQ
ncbi:iron uptake system protein EfeO [Halobacillus sp. BBL2006]|uniref:iron uptake system protein EfeO n=1 Tax=Halobacillus sp. BBL2006 TaxID=1543706 RepID=UPI000543A22E|nr:iron uptake system protein EfeO [Halobacillus sp. BBL2006]KHE70757.1 iron ABC transporter substrate-binding protein [Halobacillus sp. BBL2006]